MKEEIKKFCKSYCFSGEKNLIKEFCDGIETCDIRDCKNEKDIEKKYEKSKDKIRLLLKKHLELDNVSFLFGTGSSLMLGAISIRDIPEAIENKIQENSQELYQDVFLMLVKIFQKKDKISLNSDEESISKWRIKADLRGCFRWASEEEYATIWGNIATPLENFIDFLLGLLYVSEYSQTIAIDGENFKKEQIEELIKIIKEELFKLCDMQYPHDKLKYHKKFIKSLLGRPLNLRRANIFTTNYDLVFENAFDDLGVHYINGFCGFNDRYFRPEVYDFDMFYPGNTTEGRVRRVEKVIRYFKMHGSLTWVREEQSPNNIFGLKEYPISFIRNQYKEKEADRKVKIGDLIIYPTSYKKGYTLDFPYSELFRQFASTITQPQSVLFCIGYSFFDEHINDIIYQALSIPSFSLIIVDLSGNEKIDKLRKLNDPRIIILKGEYLGDFKHFANDIMPNFHELNVNEQISKSLKILYPKMDTNDHEEE